MFWPLDTLWLVSGAALTATLVVALRPAQPGLRTLLVLLACIASATFCYGMGLLAPDLAGKRAWTVLLLLLVLDQVRLERSVGPRFWGLALSIPVVTLLANWTNEWHHLYYLSVSVEPGSGMAYFSRQHGPLYWMFHAHVLGVLASATILLLRHWPAATLQLQRSSRALLAVLVLMIVMEGLHLFRFAFAQTLLLRFLGTAVVVTLIAWALLRWQFLDLSPVARGAVFEHMSEAFIVLDRKGAITDFNENARLWLGCSEASYGEPYQRLPALAGILLAGNRPIAPVDLGNRLVRFNVNVLRDRRGSDLGWLLLGRDDTRQQKAERALKRAYVECARRLQKALAESVRVQEEEQRRIGQELHDSVCQDLAGLSRATESFTNILQPLDNPALLARSRDLARETGRILRRTRTLAHDLALTDLGFLNFEAALESFTAHAEQWLGVSVELNLDRSVTIGEKEAACHLLRIIREAVVNAARHGQARTVWVDVVRRGSDLSFTISNDGQPLPSPGSLREGLGLRQMHLRARLLGGTLTLTQQPDGPVQLQLIIAEAGLHLPAEERFSNSTPPPYVSPPGPNRAPDVLKPSPQPA
jgi:signal transduction histidine kinase